MNKNLRTILLFVGALVLVGGLLAMVNLDTPARMDVATLATKVQSGEINEVVVKDSNTLEVTLKDGSKAEVLKEDSASFAELLSDYGVDPEKARAVKTQVEEHTGAAYWAGVILPNVLPLLLLLGIMFFFLRQVQGQNNRAMSFGQSTAREIPKGRTDKVTFADVAGVKEVKE